jgi:hypothetical protein
MMSKPEDLIGENGLLKLLTKKIVQRSVQVIFIACVDG